MNIQMIIITIIFLSVSRNDDFKNVETLGQLVNPSRNMGGGEGWSDEHLWVEPPNIK